MLGHYPDLSNADYHAAPGISKSMLDKINISPLAYWDAYINPEREPREEKHYFMIGDATHKIILEPNLFQEQYAMGFDKKKYPTALDTSDDLKLELQNRGEKVSGAKPELIRRLLDSGYPQNQIVQCLQDEYNQSVSGKNIIPAEDYKSILKMLEAVNNHHTAGKLIKNAKMEGSYFAEDENGIVRKCRPDFITANGKICGDVKTTDDVSVTAFGKTIIKFRYLVQAAWYLDTLKIIMGNDAPSVFGFVVIQKNRPYDVAVHVLSAEQIEMGRKLYKKDIVKLLDCLKYKDVWHGCDGGKILEVQLPKYFELDIVN